MRVHIRPYSTNQIKDARFKRLMQGVRTEEVLGVLVLVGAAIPSSDGQD